MIHLDPLPDQDASEITVLATEALRVLGLNEEAEPVAVANAIYGHIGQLRGQAKFWDEPTHEFSPEEAEEMALPFGALWGEQVVRGKGWRWVVLPDTRPGVASPDGAFAAAPLSDVYALLTDTSQVDSMLLLFNMIAGESLSDRKPETVVIAGHYEG